jgi:vacuolar-type H+-ATPase subunit B/Vma2
MYQLKGKASMWWDQIVQVQHIREKYITWKEFKRYFEKKYLTKRYYDMLALDEVLKNTWSYLTILELRQLVRDGAQREAEIKVARPIFLSL